MNLETAGLSRYTGERPIRSDDFHYDEARHLAPYRYAAKLAQGLRVLDGGCGEGFGTQTLAALAAQVVGLDYSAEVVEACRKAWTHPNLSFQHTDLSRPEEGSERFDLVLSFQVIEHMRDEIPFLEGLKKRIRPGGRLLLTTPNRLKSFSENPYHVREYTAPELRALLGRVFRKVTLSGIHGNQKVLEFDRARARSARRILKLDPLGIRKKLPRWLVTFAFAKLSIFVRRRAAASAGGARIEPEDFYVSPERLDDALDLLALCEP
jgi:2-polyprenyl-3-methyl-5-hydroxy-6-metoxy-1,4-benzoquinol methylase